MRLKIKYDKKRYINTKEFKKQKICSIGIMKKKRRKPRTPGIPKRSPIQVLTGLDVA